MEPMLAEEDVRDASSLAILQALLSGGVGEGGMPTPAGVGAAHQISHWLATAPDGALADRDSGDDNATASEGEDEDRANLAADPRALSQQAGVPDGENETEGGFGNEPNLEKFTPDPRANQVRATMEDNPLLLQDSVGYARDAEGHEHKGAGPGGGQFTSDGDNGSKSAEKGDAKPTGPEQVEARREKIRAEIKAIEAKFTPEQNSMIDYMFGSEFGTSLKKLPEGKKLAHAKAVYRTVSRMPKKAIERLKSGAHKFTAVGTAQQATAAFQKDTFGLLPGRKAAGFYNSHTKEVLSDGLADRPENDGYSEESVWSHEMGHAIDGPKFELSRSDEWKAIWEEEIKPGGLSDYATTEPVEGFAEFCRLAYGTDHGTGAFPKCTEFFKKRRLLK